MDDRDWLAQRFEEHRARLRGVAYRMLGSSAEADDAVQETWLRLSRSDADEIENLGGWLTTVVGRVSLNMLRTRRSRPAEPLGVHVPEPIVEPADGGDPEQQAVVADSVGLALLVVLDTLAPAERLAYVLHDVFAVPFDQIAPIVERTPDAARQLASRARRRIQGQNLEIATATAGTGPRDLDAQWEVVHAFLAAARSGDFEGLVAVLHPDAVLRVDLGPLAAASREVHGAREVAAQASTFSRAGLEIRFALVNGVPGTVSTLDGETFSIGAFTVRDGRVVALDLLADRDRLRHVDLSALDDPR